MLHSNEAGLVQRGKKVLGALLDSWHSQDSSPTRDVNKIMVSACVGGDKMLALDVLQSGHQIRINTPIWKDLSYLQIACISNSVEVAEVLISAGADVNVKGTSQDITPFALALKLPEVSMAVLLLKLGANVTGDQESVLSDEKISSLVTSFKPTQQELFMCT